MFNQSVFGIQTKEGRLISCYYWTPGTRPYQCTATCDDEDKNEYGNCTSYYCKETGEAIPADYNTKHKDCKWFHQELFGETLKVVRSCSSKAYEQGCLPKDIRGLDKVYSEKNPDGNYDPNMVWSDNYIKNTAPVYHLAEGTYIILYATTIPLYVVDINGFKGPNKWGYDLFHFQLRGDLNGGITTLFLPSYITDEGGKTTQQMMEEAFR